MPHGPQKLNSNLVDANVSVEKKGKLSKAVFARSSNLVKFIKREVMTTGKVAKVFPKNFKRRNIEKAESTITSSHVLATFNHAIFTFHKLGFFSFGFSHFLFFLEEGISHSPLFCEGRIFPFL